MADLDSASFSSGNLPQFQSPSRIALLVPQGQEYQAIVNGLQQHPTAGLEVVAIPLGVNPVNAFLETWQPAPDIAGILLMGLAGALSSSLNIGQVVVYQSCMLSPETNSWKSCSPAWGESLSQLLQAPLVKAVTSLELVGTAQAKAQLGQTTGAAVVDMEGWPILTYALKHQLEVAMVRVISDTAEQDLPNLGQAIGPDGSLNPLGLAWAFLQKPVAAGHLIAGSLRGLGGLTQVTETLAIASRP